MCPILSYQNIATLTPVYLGVNLDQSLSGSSIVNKIVTKCNNKIKFLYRNARSFDPQTKGMLASALVQCHFDYACSMWFSCVSSTSRKRLQIIQNKLIRFILGISTRSHIGYREFSSGNMLPVEYRVTQLKLNPCSAAPGCTRIAETHPTAAPGCTRE